MQSIANTESRQATRAGNGLMTSEILDRVPPTDMEAERALLCCILLQPSLIHDVDGLATADFRDEAHQAVYAAMLSLNAKRQPIDTTLLVGALRDAGKFDAIGGMATMGEIATAQPVAANWRHYLARVRRTSERRELIVTLADSLKHLYSGNPLENIKRRIGESLESVVHAEPFHFERLSCRELDSAEYRTEYLVEWTLVAGQPCIFAGAKKCLKTTLLVALGLSLSTGRDFLGKLRINRCARVLIMSGESGIATLQETARRIASALGWALGDVDGLFWSEKLPQFTNLEHLDALEELLRGDEIEVVILDPAYLMMPGEDAGNLFKQGEILRLMNDVCQRCGCTLLIAHHTKKNVADPFQPPELEDIAWSGFQEWCRQWLLVGRREKYEPGTGSHRLWLNVGGSAGHSALWALDIEEGKLPNRRWEVSVMHADEARHEVTERQEEAKQAKVDQKVEHAKQRIVRAMGKYPKGETEKVIKDTAGVGGTLARSAFSALLSDGDVVPIEITKTNRKTPYQGYKLVDREEK